MRHLRSTLALLAAAAPLGACTAIPPARAPETQPAARAPETQPEVATIDGTTAPLRDWFDAHAEHPRAVLLLSPT